MEQIEQLIAQLKGEEKALLEKREKLRKPLVQVEEDLQHITGAIAFLERKTASAEEVVVEVIAPSRLRGLTQLQAIIAIAKQNNGIVKAQDAKHMMIRAGIMKPTKNATNITHSTILRSDKFDRIAPGTYKLKDVSSPQSGFDSLIGEPPFSHTGVVKQ